MKEFGLSNETHYLEWPLQKEQQQAAFANIVEAGILGLFAACALLLIAFIPGLVLFLPRLLGFAQ